MMKPTLFLVALALLSACNKGIDGDCGTPNDGDNGCPVDIICTMDYRAVHITVTQNGLPMSLDQYKTVRISDGKEYILHTPGSYEDLSSKTNGNYPVLTDGQRKDAARSGSNFEFRGYKNGQIVVKETYNISNDCCHIHLVSGKTEIGN